MARAIVSLLVLFSIVLCQPWATAQQKDEGGPVLLTSDELVQLYQQDIPERQLQTKLDRSAWNNAVVSLRTSLRRHLERTQQRHFRPQSHHCRSSANRTTDWLGFAPPYGEFLTQRRQGAKGDLAFSLRLGVFASKTPVRYWLLQSRRKL